LPDDYPSCETLLPEDDYAEAWEFPTCVAVRDAVVIGVISTRTTGGIVSIGRLALAPGPQAPWVTLRLVESYDETLRGYGLQAYWWGIERQHTSLQALMERLGFSPINVTRDTLWYRKEL
jgi:hypothetical protein